MKIHMHWWATPGDFKKLVPWMWMRRCAGVLRYIAAEPFKSAGSQYPFHCNDANFSRYEDYNWFQFGQNWCSFKSPDRFTLGKNIFWCFMKQNHSIFGLFTASNYWNWCPYLCMLCDSSLYSSNLSVHGRRSQGYIDGWVWVNRTQICVCTSLHEQCVRLSVWNQLFFLLTQLFLATRGI